ncbi:DNA adenine methylase [Pedobacter sp. GR22-10]|uniref:DNA adenine methylase n=1 Tax=Pedobacter sp. GR22-10 TaxID=2994472 RepID=UPI0022481189|nr:DNA adenine methylase [Pedobacter sp. GR22-10]MCX2429889.1 DNA adenine methylase [Pedobacter sp. GR22-10]
MSDLILPITRYSGSKRKLIIKIWDELAKSKISFSSVLDMFGGSGSFAYMAKVHNKTVTYNDIFKFNYYIGKALIENNTLQLTKRELDSLLQKNPEKNYLNTISENFHEIYYPEDENHLIDVVVQNILDLKSENKRASAFYILFQSCLIKRPYNLFHRKNLNLRTNFNGGGFGNKTTWERPFEELFDKFYTELKTITFSNGLKNKSVNFSALDCNEAADLVYIDPPYFHKDSHVTYHSKYHFLEGLANYHDIVSNINHQTKNKEITINKKSEFESKLHFLSDLEALFLKHKNSKIVISYRNNGIPSIPEICDLLSKYKKSVESINLGKYNYALNRNNDENYEYLIIGK